MSKIALTAYVTSLAIVVTWMVRDVPLPIGLAGLFVWALGSVAALAVPPARVQSVKARPEDVR